MWLLHHITSSCLRHDASVGLFGLLNEASRRNWRTTLGTWRHLGKRGRRKWRTNQVSAVLLSPLDHGLEEAELLFSFCETVVAGPTPLDQWDDGRSCWRIKL